MIDTQIIQSFLNDDQEGIALAYKAWREPFWNSVQYHTGLDEIYRDDAYHEAIIRLQQHILSGRITSENLEVALLAYLKRIGYYVAKEIIRDRDSEREWATDDFEGMDIEIPEDWREVEERERLIRQEVSAMGKPCAPLLLGFYWQKYSMEKLAEMLGYSNADSAKAQKAKCMKKVQTYIKAKLNQYGYGL